MKRLPQLYYGPKAKEQILQKWDPVSKRLIIATPTREAVIRSVNMTKVSGVKSIQINWSIYFVECDQYSILVTLDIFRSANPNGSSPTKFDTIQTTNNSHILENPAEDFYYYAIITLPQGGAVTSNIFAYGSIISTIAGTGIDGFNQDDIAATSAFLNFPTGVAVDSTGNVYIADAFNNRIRKITGTTITTIAGTFGSGGFSGDGGLATSAQLDVPIDIAIDSAGNVYIADISNNRIRKITSATGNISTIADGLNGPSSVAVDSAGNVYIADTLNHIIRKITGGTIIKIAGTSGDSGFSGDGGVATSARLNGPTGVAVDSAGNVYIADTNNHRIRKITGTTITTIAGTVDGAGFSGDGFSATSAQLSSPRGVAVDSVGNVYIADANNYRIRKITFPTGAITTIAGNGDFGFSGDGLLATDARLSNAFGTAVDSAGNVYIADLSNNRIRKISVL